MNLEQLPKALHDLKGKLLTYVMNEAAPLANDQLIRTLYRRAGSGSKQNNKATPAPAGQRLNEKQKRFLKPAPVAAEPTSVIIRATKNKDGYAIAATAGSNSLSVTDSDMTVYRKTISEHIKKSIDKLL